MSTAVEAYLPSAANEGHTPPITSPVCGAAFGNAAAADSSSALSNLGTESWSETAFAWWQRSRRRRKIVQPKNPSAAARAFVQQPTLGFLHVNTARRRQPSNARSNKRRRGNPQLPLVELSGPTAKTITLLTLAAQFVVKTRPSRFPNTTSNDSNNAHRNNDDKVLLPHVFILDAHWEISASMIHKLIRAQLLCDYDNMATDNPATGTNTQEQGDEPTDDVERLMTDCESCAHRVHVAQADENNSAGWLPILESLKAHLAQASLSHPTLVLWDGLMGGSTPLQNSSVNTNSSTEIQRSLLRLLREYDVMLVYTTTNPLTRKKSEWDERVTNRVRFDYATAGLLPHTFVAQSEHDKNNPTPFSISTAGVRL